MRIQILAATVASLALVGVGVVGAATDSPDPVVVTETAAPVAADTSDIDQAALSKARKALSSAGLPLSLLGGGVGQLTEGGAQLQDGARQLSDGLGLARDAAGQIADGTGQLKGGVALLGDGASQVSGGVDTVVGTLSGLGDTQAEVIGTLTGIADTVAILPDPVSQGAAAQLRSAVDSLNAKGLGPDTMAQLNLLRDGARQLSYELNDPAAQFPAGVALLADGTGQLRDGLVQLDDGGKLLAAGTDQLVSGIGPVTGVVKGLDESVRNATAALPKNTPPAKAEPAPEATVVAAPAADRRWWPYPLIVVGALALAAIALLGNRERAVPAPAPEPERVMPEPDFAAWR
ncbi:hypothetical protein [Rhodococcus kronopolitis]|uniref:X-X-X-Leu-X-X-Gly heptad repeat protein n=1 Tax=Rhodococcus kronopolitis TaxID=1460226 RepID=A0ABV9FY57_9NOCA